VLRNLGAVYYFFGIHLTAVSSLSLVGGRFVEQIYDVQQSLLLITNKKRRCCQNGLAAVADCDAFLPKPLDIALLLETLARLLGLTWLYAAASETANFRQD
jgi:hypothetical protein